jgi:precorrin-3B synthase
MTRRGWCPTLFAPMQSGDGLLLRVKPRLGVLTAPAARALADAARRLGNGMLGLTNRGNLQLRGFTGQSASQFAAIAVDLGLAHPEPGAEARRNVLVSPLIGLDPDLDPAAFDLARMLDDLLSKHREFAPLFGKFGVVVDGGGVLPMQDVTGDILLQPEGGEVLISLDGSRHAARVALAECQDAVRRLVLAFLADGLHRRMREARAGTIFAAAGLAADAQTRLRPSRPAIGVLPGAIGLGLPFGLLHAEDLVALAALAEQRGDATLRLTPWRAVLLPGLDNARNIRLPATTAITDPRDPLLRVAACPGAPFCGASSVDTLGAARTIAAHAAWNGTLHVSGCAKGCAHPNSAEITLVGEDGGWNLIRDDRPNALPLLRGRSIGSIVESLAPEMTRTPT